LARVEAGEQVVFARAGRPVARLVPIAARGRRRLPGRDTGRGRISDDFDAPLPPDVLKAFTS
jgi:antitoxin (DNA-binding transcriptional repressor) of toxin-antitoxin stability system